MFRRKPIPQGLDGRISQGNVLAGLHADKRVGGRAAVDQLVVRLLGINEGWRDDASFLQQAKRAIHRGFRHVVRRPGTQLAQQAFGFEQTVGGDDGIEHVGSLLGIAEIPLLQEATKDRAQRRENLDMCGRPVHG